jgi:hypothetical protein
LINGFGKGIRIKKARRKFTDNSLTWYYGLGSFQNLLTPLKEIIMGVSLWGKKRSFISNWGFYGSMLELAAEYGWEPRGTVLTFHFCYQVCGCGADTAKNDPDYEIEKKAVKACANWNGSYFSNDQQTVTQTDAKNIADALERALDDGQEANLSEEIRDFIEFCREGQFSIW